MQVLGVIFVVNQLVFTGQQSGLSNNHECLWTWERGWWESSVHEKYDRPWTGQTGPEFEERCRLGAKKHSSL